MVFEVHFQTATCLQQSASKGSMKSSLPSASPSATIATMEQIMQQVEDGCAVVVQTQPPAGKVPSVPSASADEPDAKSMSALKLEVKRAIVVARNTCVKVGNTWAPWKANKNAVRAQTASKGIEQQGRLLLGLLDSMEAEVAEARKQMAGLAALQTKLAEQQQSLEKQAIEIAQLQQAKAQEQAKVQELHLKMEEAAPKKKYIKDEHREVEHLPSRVDALVAEAKELRAENEKLVKAKEVLSKKLKELQDKARDDAEVREREFRRVLADARRERDTAVADAAAARAELEEANATRIKDAKAAARRTELAKNEVEALKGREKTLKAQLEEATTALSKAQEDAKTASRRAADTRAAKEELTKELELVHEESSMLQAQYKEAMSALASKSGSPSAAMASLPTGRVLSASSSAAWPRTCFTVRNGCVLHSQACSQNMDTSRVVPREFKNIKEMESVLVNDGMVLCSKCCAGGSF